MEHDHGEGGKCLACEMGMDAFMDHTIETIAEYGWTVQYVSAGEDSVPFFYSAGMCRFGLPDIMFVGNLDPKVILQLINDVGTLMRQEGAFVDGSTSTEIIRKFYVVFRQVTPETSQAHCTILHRLFGDNEPVLQMFIPDEHGRFPWDADCDWMFQVDGLKPLAYLSPAHHLLSPRIAG